MRRNEYIRSLLQQCESHCPTVENNTCKSKTDSWLPSDPDQGEENPSTSSSDEGMSEDEKTGMYITAAIVLGIVGFWCGRKDDGFREVSLGAETGANVDGIEMAEESRIDDFADYIPSPLHANGINPILCNTSSIAGTNVAAQDNQFQSPMHSIQSNALPSINSFNKPKSYPRASIDTNDFL